MTTTEAIKILTYANKWRRDNSGELKMPIPKQLGLAIDHAIEVLKRFKDAVEVEPDCPALFLPMDDYPDDSIDWIRLYAIPKEQNE